jgi:hypothetical protein
MMAPATAMEVEVAVRCVFISKKLRMSCPKIGNYHGNTPKLMMLQ